MEGAGLLVFIITCCVCVVFPVGPAYVQVTVVLLVIGKVALCVPVIVPAQACVAVGAVNEVTAQLLFSAVKFVTVGVGF